MICDTVKKGNECIFMKKSGCGLQPKTCYPIVEKCGQCKNVETFNSLKYCKSYMNPTAIWMSGCPLNTEKIIKKEEVKKLNPLKASKKSAKKKKK